MGWKVEPKGSKELWKNDPNATTNRGKTKTITHSNKGTVADIYFPKPIAESVFRELRGVVLALSGSILGAPGGRFGTLGVHFGDPGPPRGPQRRRNRKKL